MENTPNINELIDVDPNELVDVSTEQSPQASELVSAKEEELSGSKAAKMGLYEGLSFSQAAEISAIPKTTTDVLNALSESYSKEGIMGTVNVLPSILETHRQNTRIEQEVHDKLRDKYPAQYIGSEMAGSLASEAAFLAIPGLIGAPITLSGILSSHFAVNFAHGLGKANTDSLAENINEAIEAGKGGAAMPIWLQKGAQSLARAGTYVGKKGGQFLIDKGLLDNKKFVKQGMLKFLGLGEEAVGLSAEQFGKETDDLLYRVAGYTGPDGVPLIEPSATRIDTLKKFSAARKVEGDAMGDMLLSLGKGSHKHPATIFENIDEAIFQGPKGMLNKADIDEAKQAYRVRENLQALFFDKNPDTGLYDINFPNPNFSPYSVHDYMQSAYKQSRQMAKNIRRGTAIDPIEGTYFTTKKRIADMLWEDLDDMIRPTPIYKDYVTTKSKYGDLKLIEDQLRDTIKPDANKGASFITKLVKERLVQGGTTLALMTGAGAGYSQNNKPLMYASLAALGLQAVYENPRVNGFVATTARNVAEELQKNPDKYNKMAGVFISLLNRGDGTPAIDHLGVMAANMELSNRPLARTTQDVITKQNAVLTLVNEMDPKVAKNLKEAIDLGDEQTIAGIMTSIAHKAPKGLVEQGIGWDNRAITPEDKAAVMSKLKTLSPRQRSLLIPQFEQDGIIPQEYYNQVNPKPTNVFEHVKSQRQNGIKRPEF